MGGADQEKYLIRRSTASVKIYLPSICVRGFEPLKIFFCTGADGCTYFFNSVMEKTAFIFHTR